MKTDTEHRIQTAQVCFLSLSGKQFSLLSVNPGSNGGVWKGPCQIITHTAVGVSWQSNLVKKVGIGTWCLMFPLYLDKYDLQM